MSTVATDTSAISRWLGAFEGPFAGLVTAVENLGAVDPHDRRAVAAAVASMGEQARRVQNLPRCPRQAAQPPLANALAIYTTVSSMVTVALTRGDGALAREAMLLLSKAPRLIEEFSQALGGHGRPDAFLAREKYPNT